MSAPRRVLFLTNSEYGQANAVLAVVYALLHASTDVEVHVASFKALGDAIRLLSTYALETAPGPKRKNGIIFHEINGQPYARTPLTRETFDLKPSLYNTSRVLLAVPEVISPWKPAEFTVVCEEVERIVDEVRPDLTLVEPLFSPGLTICLHRGVKWMVLAPNTIKDFAVPVQPALAALWKYPLVCSALPFPLPWHLIPYNIALNLVAGYMILTDKRVAAVSDAVKSRYGPEVQLITANELGVLTAPPKGVHFLVANTAELDYPFNRLPDYITPCGPIVRASKSLLEVDPGLHSWLERGPAVYVNLGTYLTATADEAAELAGALHDLLLEADRKGFGHKGARLRVLWKLGRKDTADSDGRPVQSSEQDWTGDWEKVAGLLRTEMDTDRARITGWFTAEPKSIIESKNIICSVHHGGASSFNEALCAGVPQVLLPPWADCYDFANRAELLGIGVWANKNSTPRWRRQELASALIRVVLGPDSESFKFKAAGLAAKYLENAGRDRAAKEILKSL
ncbi:hypothetical protein E8E14_002405 [Neopestalotiopsis sp. 37M]|nr:hypothetical protein E8E14_002405 [Neopestalotiopsis sp. 37M]